METVMDDGERVGDTLFTIGVLVLSTLNRLEQANLLIVNSPIPNIPVILSTFFEWLPNFSDAMSGEEDQVWPNQIVAYAQKYEIEIKGLYNVEEGLEEYGVDDLDDEQLERVNSPAKADKFGFNTKVGSNYATSYINAVLTTYSGRGSRRGTRSRSSRGITTSPR
jgi:hypothetical protein